MKTPIVGELYKHYKGGVYLVVMIAKSSENGEYMIVYYSLTGEHYVSTLTRWNDYVTIDDSRVKRFELFVEAN